MNKAILLAVTLLVSTSVLASPVSVGKWHGLEAGVVGVQSSTSTATLTLATVENEANDNGVALFYYPPNQPTVCAKTTEIKKSFVVNGRPITFKKFCFEGSSQTTAYTPATSNDVEYVITRLAAAGVKSVSIDKDVFSTHLFTDSVDLVLHD